MWSNESFIGVKVIFFLCLSEEVAKELESSYCVCVWANVNNSCTFLCKISKFNETDWWKHIFPHDLILNILIDPILGMFKNSSKQKMIHRIKPKMKLEVRITTLKITIRDNPIRPIPLSNTSSPKAWSATLSSGEGFNPCFKVKLMFPHHWFTSKVKLANHKWNL